MRFVCLFLLGTSVWGAACTASVPGNWTVAATWGWNLYRKRAERDASIQRHGYRERHSGSRPEHDLGHQRSDRHLR